MSDVQIRIVLLTERAKLPEYKSAGAAGADLFAAFDGPPIKLAPKARAIIPTGIALEIPSGAEAQIRPRSGLAANHGITVLNSPGTIDSDYRGEIKFMLFNTSDAPFLVNSGDRVAQIVFTPVLRAQFDQTDYVPHSLRGGGGFGSTGQ